MPNLCDKVHGQGLYFIYRLLSGESHPGWPIIGRHFNEDDGRLEVRTEARATDLDLFWGWVLLASLLWDSGTAGQYAVAAFKRRRPHPTLRPASGAETAYAYRGGR